MSGDTLVAAKLLLLRRRCCVVAMGWLQVSRRRCRGDAAVATAPASFLFGSGAFCVVVNVGFVMQFQGDDDVMVFAFSGELRR